MKIVKGYITSEELNKVLLLLDNPQDRFIVIAVYRGIAGKNNMSELLNIKTKDVNFNNHTITLEDRVVTMDKQLEKATKEAINQSVLYVETRNGNGSCKEELYLNMDSPYLIKTRPSTTNKNGLDPMKYGGFRSRFAAIRQKAGLEVNASQLETSGVVNQLLSEKKDWTVLDVEFALRMKNIKANAYRIYSIIKEVTS